LGVDILWWLILSLNVLKDDRLAYEVPFWLYGLCFILTAWTLIYIIFIFAIHLLISNPKKEKQKRFPKK